MRGVRPPDGGWGVVAALTVAEPVSWGVLYYAFAAIQGPMGEGLGWSRTEVTGAFSLALLVSGLAAIPAGRWLDRHGPRGLMTAGAVLGVAAVAAWSRAGSLPVYYGVMAALGLAMAGTLYEPAFAAVARWFPAAPSRPMMTVTLGGALASPIFLPLTSWLAGRTDWRTALLVLAGVLAVVTVPLHALMVRDRPGAGTREGLPYDPPADGGGGSEGWPSSPMEGVGLALNPGASPPGRGEKVGGPSREVRDGEGTGIPLREVLRARTFWWFNASVVLSVVAVGATTVHLIPYLTERGTGATLAATATGLSNGLALVGRLIVAPLGDRIRRQALVAAIHVLQAAGIACLVLLGDVGIWLFVGLAGMAGAATPLRAALLAELFGTASYGAIGGASALLRTLAVAATPVGTSLVIVAMGGYDALLWSLVVGCLLAAAAILAAGRERRPAA